MVRSLVVIAFAATLVGCGNTADPAKPALTTTAPKPAPPTGSGTDPGILPMGGGAMSPVTNPGAVDGAGSNVGQAAKNAAKAAAGKESQSTAGQTSGGDD